MHKNEYPRLKKLTVVYAEDEAEIRDIASGFFKPYFANFVAAPNGMEAYKIIKELKPDVLITDIMMPMQNGLEFIRKLDEENGRPGCVFIVTAFCEEKYLLDSIRLRVDGYAVKPFEPKDILEQIEKIFAAKEQSAELEYAKRLMKAISVFVGGKKIEIIKHLMENVDENNVFKGSYEDIMSVISVSKPTVVSTFKQLSDAGIIEKIKNKIYKLNI